VPYDSYSIHVDSEIKLLRNIKKFNHLPHVFLFKTGIAAIKNRFPFGDIENARNLRSCIQYLIHLNDSEKAQYSWQEVKTNCPDMTPYKTQANSYSKLTLQTILEKINTGGIREYNQYTEIPIEIWSKSRLIITNALTYHREQICMDKHRNVNVTFINGAAGFGKTTFAKKLCEDNSKSYCISLSSNDPLQDYKGEDVLILDDLRDSDFKFTDLLKILDNHTKSIARSRYNNKAFIGNEIIITSFVSLDLLYSSLSDPTRDQLYRRIRFWYKFYLDHIDLYSLDEKTLKYQLIGSAPNLIKIQIDMKAIEQQKIDEMLKANGFEFAPHAQEVTEAKPAGTNLSWFLN
jgi:hypothetical protein